MKYLIIGLVVGIVNLFITTSNCVGAESPSQLCVRFDHPDSGVVWYMGDLIKPSGGDKYDFGEIHITRLLGIVNFQITEREIKNVCVNKENVHGSYRIVVLNKTGSKDLYHGHLDKTWVDVNVY